MHKKILNLKPREKTLFNVQCGEDIWDEKYQKDLWEVAKHNSNTYYACGKKKSYKKVIPFN